MRPRTDELYDFVAIGELADTTKQFIYLNLAYNIRRQNRRGGLEQVEQMVLQQARDYLGRVREGFVLSVRTADVTSREELGYLLERVLLDWEAFREELGLHEESVFGRDGSAETARRVEHVRDQLMAFGMAAIALGMLPRLPHEEVTFPKNYRKPPTYADIPVPNSPAEMLQRIEELEKMVWQMAAHDPIDLMERSYASLRRTYGFFESSAWLSRRESERFGIKTQKRALS